MSGLRHRLRVVRVLFAATFSLLAEYRAELAIWVVAGSLPLIMMFAWIGIAADRPIAGTRISTAEICSTACGQKGCSGRSSIGDSSPLRMARSSTPSTQIGVICRT